MLNGMKLVAWPFLTKLKTVLSIAFVTKCAAIMVLIVYGLTHQGFINNLQRIKPVPKAPPGILYSDYFAPDIVKKNASIVIIVLSAIEKYQRREAVRNSWLKDCKKHTQVRTYNHCSSKNCVPQGCYPGPLLFVLLVTVFTPGRAVRLSVLKSSRSIIGEKL